MTKFCMSIQQGLEGKEGTRGFLDSRPTIDAVGSACISSKLCFFFVFFCWGLVFLICCVFGVLLLEHPGCSAD